MNGGSNVSYGTCQQQQTRIQGYASERFVQLGRTDDKSYFEVHTIVVQQRRIPFMTSDLYYRTTAQRQQQQTGNG